MLIFLNSQEVTNVCEERSVKGCIGAMNPQGFCQPPATSPTAQRMYAQLMGMEQVVRVAIVAKGNWGSAADFALLGSEYDEPEKIVVFRADAQMKLVNHNNMLQPSIILLYHEFGHVMQFHVDMQGNELLALDRNGPTVGHKPPSKWTPTVQIPIYGPNSWADHGHAYHLELDNMQRYEHAVSREMGVPIRNTYKELQFDSFQAVNI